MIEMSWKFIGQNSLWEPCLEANIYQCLFSTFQTVNCLQSVYWTLNILMFDFITTEKTTCKEYLTMNPFVRLMLLSEEIMKINGFWPSDIMRSRPGTTS